MLKRYVRAWKCTWLYHAMLKAKGDRVCGICGQNL